MKNKNVAFMTQAAMIAAIYVVLTYVFAPFSFGEVQIRIAEALTILPVFTPAAIPGLYVSASQQEPFPCTITADPCEYSDRSVRTSLRIWNSTSDSVYDADSWCRRSCRMWCAWISPLYCIKSL